MLRDFVQERDSTLTTLPKQARLSSMMLAAEIKAQRERPNDELASELKEFRKSLVAAATVPAVDEAEVAFQRKLQHTSPL